ncbi:hypothetical protein AL398_11185, partial [Clostridium botulinum]
GYPGTYLLFTLNFEEGGSIRASSHRIKFRGCIKIKFILIHPLLVNIYKLFTYFHIPSLLKISI